MSLFQDQSLYTKIVSSLEVKAKTTKLPCGKEEDFTIVYSIAGEEKGKADLMYLVSGGAGLHPITQNIFYSISQSVTLFLVDNRSFIPD